MNSKDYIFSHIIAVDPSGAFYEGQGTSGFCVFNAVDMYIQQTEYISALKYASASSYWTANIDTLDNLRKKYPKSGIIIEDYILYKDSAMAQVNSRMETCQLLGLLHHYLDKHCLMHRFETAATVMSRWPNEILIHKGYIQKRGKAFADAQGNVINRHVLDATRHAVHNATFYNKPEGAYLWKDKY